MHRFDYLMGQQCWIPDRQTYRLYRQFGLILTGKINSTILRMVSSVLRNGLHINTLISHCREMWAENGWRAWWGRGWEPAASIGLLVKICFVLFKRAWWAFRWWLQPGWRGLMCTCFLSPSSDRCGSPETRVKNAGWGPRTRPHSPHACPPPAPNQ